MLNIKNILKIGIGTWGIGGFAERNPQNDDKKQIDALIHMLNSGLNFVEANLWYSQGKSVELLATALRNSNVKRENIFICQAVYIKNGDFETAEREVLSALKIFDTNYIDTFQFTGSVFNEFGFERCVKFVEKMIVNKTFRYTSITNENLELLKNYHKVFGEKLFSHEVCFNFEVRENEKLGMIPYADKNKIKTVLYQPLRRNRTALRNWSLLIELSQKYNATQNQIILAWLISRGFLPLTKSENIDHIHKHIEAINIKLDKLDINKLNNFTVPNYKSPKIDWNKSGDGIDVSQLSNVFDEEYNKQNGL